MDCLYHLNYCCKLKVQHLKSELHCISAIFLKAVLDMDQISILTFLVASNSSAGIQRSNYEVLMSLFKEKSETFESKSCQLFNLSP